MIFDSPQMEKLRKKYAKEPNYAVPSVILLERHSDFAGERRYLEDLAKTVPSAKRTGLLRSIIQQDEASHQAAWFELMLYGWLKEAGLGLVEIEPAVEGHVPDFLLHTNSQEIVIEAKVHLIEEGQREHNKKVDQVIWAIRELQRPFMVNIESLEVGHHIDISELKSKVDDWLEFRPNERYEYSNDAGYRIILTANDNPRLTKVSVLRTSDFRWISPEPLKRPLRKKASQHKKIRHAGYPYVIAIYLESLFLSAEEVVEAWLGIIETVFDTKTLQVVEERSDRSGIHFYGNNVLHKSVSGTLVFKSTWLKQFQRRQLSGWYIENPYAADKVDPGLFPVESSFRVIEKTEQSYRLDWVS